MKRLLALASSARLAAVLIALLAALSLVGVVFPQREITGEALPPTLSALGLDRVFASWPFLAVVALLGVNVVACTADRVVRYRRRVPKVPSRAPAAATPLVTPLAPAEAVAVAEGALRGWRVTRSADRSALRAETGTAGFAGSILAHAGLVVLIAGGVLSALASFAGTMLLTEGQTLPDAPSSYLTVDRSPRAGNAYTGFTVGLDSLAFSYDGPTVTDAVARLTVTDRSGVRTVDARVNEPLVVDGKSFLLLNAGYSAGIEVTDATGTPLLATFVTLGNAVAEGYYDDVEAGATQLRLLAVPDAKVPLGTAAVRRLEPTDPGLWVTPAGGQPVLMRPGETREIAGLRVTFGQMRRWNRFLVRADGGRLVVYAAFAMLLAGTALRLLYPDRYLAVLAEPHASGSRVVSWGTSRLGRPGLDRALAAVSSTLSAEKGVA